MAGCLFDFGNFDHCRHYPPHVFMCVCVCVCVCSSECVCGCVCADDQQELFPECVSCVTWLKAYFSDPNTTHTLPSPTIHHPTLQGGNYTHTHTHTHTHTLYA